MKELESLSLLNGAMTHRCVKYMNRLEQMERLEFDCFVSAGMLRIVKKITNGRAVALRKLKTLVLRNVKQGTCLKQVEDFGATLSKTYPFLEVIVREKSDPQPEGERLSEDEIWL